MLAGGPALSGDRGPQGHLLPLSSEAAPPRFLGKATLNSFTGNDVGRSPRPLCARFTRSRFTARLSVPPRSAHIRRDSWRITFSTYHLWLFWF